MKNIPFLTLLFSALFMFTSCDKDEPTMDDRYEIPTSYNFSAVNYSGQTQRLGMFTEFKAYMKSANVAGTILDANRLAAMYANDGAVSNWNGTYEASKQMRSKTFEPVQEIFDQLLENLATASESTVAGSDGIAGVVMSNDGAKNYLLNAAGIELGQVIEKGLMGALLYYQSTSVYFEPGKMDVDNESADPIDGTAMEHHWDEAFGYFGVPIDFPTNTDGLAFWGDYCNDRNQILGSNNLVMDGFLKGRAAISNKDLTSRDEAISEVRAAWEKVVVGSALHYLNSGHANFDDMALRAHGLSEAIGFIYSLQFNVAKKITTSQINELLTLIGGTSDILDANLYDVEATKILEARDKLAEWFELTDLKNDF